MSLVRAGAGRVDEPLDRWQVCAAEPEAVVDPSGLERAALEWIECSVPTTAAAALRAAGRFSLDGPARRFDAHDWWFKTRFARGERRPDEEIALCFDGLATVCEVWLNGARLFRSDNMFVAHRHAVKLEEDNELVVRCHALDPLLAQRRPRPRWRAPMVEHQQLRWFRTTLLGRTPGWSPPAAAVGPWRPVRLERRRGISIDDVRIRAGVDGRAGRVDLSLRLRSLAGELGPLEAVIEREDGVEARAALAPAAEEPGRLAARLRLRDVRLWWPHTHGEPALYRVRLEASAGGESFSIDLGTVGFREIELDSSGGRFALRVNGAPLFCRGACWTPLDPVALSSSPEAYAGAFAQLREAGMNMLRVAGPTVYETDAFYDLADQSGVLLWQDFMFANMDYPEQDEAFVASATEEAAQLLARLQGRPSVAVLCGNSEAEQQAAMWGASRESWSQALFSERLAAIARERRPDAIYWPSSAHGGAFPHQADAGTASYYGVGAYLRPLEDARRSRVRFATECLAFANVPEPRGLKQMPGGLSVRSHHPGWKARTPRDLGAGWDFDDVRDHYVAELFGVDPAALRYSDHERYLALGRVAVGEVMAATFGEWRRADSACRGALVWFLRDLWHGPGWGLLDAGGRPKAPYHYLRRALQPVAMHLSDEGCNGLTLHLFNERPAPLAAVLEVALYRGGEVGVGDVERPVELDAGAATALPVASLFDRFIDLSFAYRFGRPPCDLVVATLRAQDRRLLARAFHFPIGLPSTREADLGLSAEVSGRDDGGLDLTVQSRRFAQAIAVDFDGFAPEDSYFHLPPGGERTLRLRRAGVSKRSRGSVQALNCESAISVAIKS